MATTSTQMLLNKNPADKSRDEESSRESAVGHKVSLPVFQILYEEENNASKDSPSDLKPRRDNKKRKVARGMEVRSTGVGQVHRSGRKSKAHSRHEHKCHKAKHKSRESLAGRGERFSSPDNKGSRSVGLFRTPGMLSPFETNLASAYRLLRTENAKLKADVVKLMEEKEEIRAKSSGVKEENEILKGDVSLMKNLVYKLNVELEKYQSGGRRADLEKIPDDWDKNLIGPVLPLLRAFEETIREKKDIIGDLESEQKKFNAAFNDLLEENEKLYGELEKKFTGGPGSASSQLQILKKDLEMAKQENNLLFHQIKLEKEKLAKVHSALKVKVEEVSKEKQNLVSDVEEQKADLYLLRGKYAVLKQEYERLKMDYDTRVPLAVHSASVNECRKLFQDLKNEYENERERMSRKIKEQEGMLTKQCREGEEWAQEKNHLERSNFDQTFEIESLRRKVSELENHLEGRGGSLTNGRDRKELIELKKQLRESNKKVEELSSKLTATKKQLQKAMMFAEDIVRGQEGLLLQLHEKQKENNYMTTQFGSLKNQIKDVERGAQQGLNSIEEKIRSLEAENYTLGVHNRKLEKLLAEKEEMIKNLEPTKDS